MKTALKFVGYLIAVLLMAAGLIAIVLYIMGLGSVDLDIITTMAPTETSSPAPNGSTTLEDTQQNGTSSVTVGTPTPVPTVTPSPTPSPTPTPVPTPPPMPAGTPLGGGTFSSDTGVWIDLDAVWSAETVDQETVKVTVVANLRSFSLQTGESHDALQIKVGDEMTSMDLKGISLDTSTEVTTELGSYTFEIPAPAGRITLIPVEVNWYFGGTYSQKKLDVVTAKGDIQIER